MNTYQELSEHNSFFLHLLQFDINSNRPNYGRIVNDSLRLCLIDRLVGETFEYAVHCPAILMKVFGQQHGRSITNRIHDFLKEHNSILENVTDIIPKSPDIIDKELGLSIDELRTLSLLCYIHDIGAILKPESPDSEQRLAAVEFVLANSPMLDLSNEEAAVLGSLVNVITFSDIINVNDWHKEGIRYRIVAAALVFGNLLDAGIHRLKGFDQWSDYQRLPQWLLLPHICIRNVSIQYIPGIEAGFWCLNVNYWAPNERRVEAEKWLNEYFMNICRDTRKIGIGEFKIKLHWLRKTSNRELTLHLFPKEPLSQYPIPPSQHRNQIRNVSLRRLLLINDNITAVFNNVCQWLVINYISPNELYLTRTSEMTKELVGYLHSHNNWDWDKLHAICKSKRSINALRYAALKLALSADRYIEKNEYEFGSIAAKIVSDLIRNGLCDLPLEISSELFTEWCAVGGNWHSVATEVILGKPTIFGRAGCEALQRRIPELLLSCNEEELSEVVTDLPDIIPKIDWYQGIKHELLDRMFNNIDVTNSKDILSKKIVAIIIMANTVKEPIDDREIILARYEDSICTIRESLNISEAFIILNDTEQYWRAFHPLSWIQFATYFMAINPSRNEQYIVSILRLVYNFINNIERDNKHIATDKIKLISTLNELDDRLRDIENGNASVSKIIASRCRKILNTIKPPQYRIWSFM